MDSPRTQRPGGPQPESIPDMPPLEGDDAEETGAPTSAAVSGVVGGGDVFLILNLPPNATVGCDARAIGTGASGFQGVRDIPPGPHFIWVAVPGVEWRTGYWFVTKDGAAGRGEVRVKQWHEFHEELADPESDVEARDHKANVASRYPKLVPYAYFTGRESSGPAAGASRSGTVGKDGEEGEDTTQLWRRLTACISDPVLARVTGKPADAGEFLFDTEDSGASDPNHAVGGNAGTLHYLFPEEDIDVHSIGDQQGGEPPAPDTSDHTLRLIDTPGTGVTAAHVVGELQLTFLVGLHLGNMSCAHHWWYLLLFQVILRAPRLALLRPGLCRTLLETFHAQMMYDEEYTASSSSSSSGGAASAPRGGGDRYAPAAGPRSTTLLDYMPGNNRPRLQRALKRYKRRLGELLLDPPPGGDTAGQREVGRAFMELEAWFWCFGWDLRTDCLDWVGDENKGSRSKGQGRGAHGPGEMGHEEEEEEGMGNGEDDEYRPVIVDLDEDGREVGLVSFN